MVVLLTEVKGLYRDLFVQFWDRVGWTDSVSLLSKISKVLVEERLELGEEDDSDELQEGQETRNREREVD